MLDPHVTSWLILKKVIIKSERFFMMDYTVNQLAKLSGVTVRTLRFYDEIGLLKPAFIAENGYRYYQEKELLILQQILFFRELGFELKQIQEILRQSDFDQMKALASHKEVLQAKINHLKTLMITIDKTVNHVKGNQTMSEKELFFGLQDYSPEYQEFYRNFIKSSPMMEKFFDDLYEKTKHLKPEDREVFKQEEVIFWKNLRKAFDKKLNVESVEVQQLIKEYIVLGEKQYKPLTYDLLIRMAALMPLMVSQFEKTVERWPEFKSKEPVSVKVLKKHPELASFMEEAMKVYAERNLK